MLNRIFTLLMIIIPLSIDLSYGTPRINSKIAGERADNLTYQLTENVFPEHYTLKITPQIIKKTFMGYAKILIHLKKPTDNITLHQKNLTITKEKIYLTTMDNLVIDIKNASNSGTEEQEFYTIIFPKLLTENKYYLHIPEFHGVLSENLKGFYYGKYRDPNSNLSHFAMTKFEPTSARYAFPCFDEPSFRAKFKIYIVRPSNYNSRSNAKLIKSIKLNNSLYEDEFEDTLSMPTYLLEYIVSEMKLFAYPDKDFYNILARPEVIDKGYARYGFNLSIKILKTLETYLNVNYSMNKFDQAAIPSWLYESGATEHWGLITYKESTFLFTPQTETSKHMEVDKTLSHEIAHQWFGNLVSIKWWRYLWLKEGFATYFQEKILDKIKPEWRKMEYFVAVTKSKTLNLDSSKLTRDMNQDAGTRKEIEDLYDPIAYGKAACVIHMMEAILTPSVFKLGLTNFLQDRAFQSCIPTDLYRNLQKSLNNSTVKLSRNLNVEKIMTTWDSQKGYPLVYVERNYDKTLKLVKLTQSRYLSQEVVRSQPKTWYIPINYVSKSDPNFNDTRFSSWLLKPNESITISNLKRDDWLILNKQQACKVILFFYYMSSYFIFPDYYRVNYDEKNWKLIAKELKENYRNIHILNRVQLIDDSFDLAKMDLLDYSIPFEISSYLEQENNYSTDFAFLRSVENIANILRGADVEPYFRDYVIRSLEKSYKGLSSNPKASDTHIDKLHREKVVSWMCKYNYSDCRANAWKTFDHWRKTNKSLDVDLEKGIMCNAIRHGNGSDWDYLLLIWRGNSETDYDAGEALGCTENATLLQRYMDLPHITSIYLVNAVKTLHEKGLVGSEVSRLYVAEHFNFLQSTKGSLMVNILRVITSYFTTEAQLDKYIKLLSENRTLDPIYLEIFEKARPAISQVEKRVKRIANFFYNIHHRNITTLIRSGGNLCRTIPNIYAFTFNTLIFVIIFHL